MEGEEREWGWGGKRMAMASSLSRYLFVRRNMLLSRKSGIEKLESAVHRDSDIIPQRGHGGEPGGCVCC